MIKDIALIIRIQNMNLLKYIAYKEGWDYIDLCKKYLQ